MTASRIVLTGGPAAGKTTLAGVISREHPDRLSVIPEAASILFSGGFPRRREPQHRGIVQSAIYSVQDHLERLFDSTHPEGVHLCDRGTLDGAAYWPGGLPAFCATLGTTREEEYARYRAVIFLRTSAREESTYADNLIRIEQPQEAREIDELLHTIWKDHPGFRCIPNQREFSEKLDQALTIVREYL